MVLVSLTLRMADSVGIPAGSPLRCRMIRTGRQLLKLTAGEETSPKVAMIPAKPGFCAVASPLASTLTTAVEDWLDCVQLNGPTKLVMSVALLKALAVNWAVCLLELQPGNVFPLVWVTWIEVTAGCMVTWIGALLTPPALA